MNNFSIIQKSQLEGANRIDAEYYQPEYLSLVNRVKKISKPLGEIVKTIKHPAEIERIYEDSGVPFLLTQNISSENYNLQYQEKRFIRQTDADKIPQNKLIFNDVLMTRTGANYGDTALYNNEPNILYASAHVLIIRLKDLSGEYLATYLNSSTGRTLVKRGVYGGLQPEISPEYLKTLLIPIPKKQLLEEITDLVNNAKLMQGNSVELYSQAEDLLLEELGLKDYKIENNLSFVVNFSGIKSADRVDAEYFQPKYQKLFSIIKTHDPKLLGEIASIKKGFEPGSEAYQEEGKKFIRVSNLTKLGFDDGDQKYISDDLYEKLKNNFEPKEGEILLTKDATPGITYLIKEPFEGIISGGILRLITKTNIDSEYLSLVINSIVGQWQAQRDAGGAIIVHWRPEQIKNMMIPLLPKETRQKIADLVRKSHKARQKSKELLEEAKRKVEEMIEKN